MKTFTIGLCGGWGARLFMLGGAIVFAARHNRQLRFFWDHRFVCPWEYFTLTPPVGVLSEDQWMAIRAAAPHARDWLAGAVLWCDDLGVSNVPDLAVSAVAIPPELGITDQMAMAALTRAVDFSRVEALVPSVDVSGVVGVHVRRTDYVDPIKRSPTTAFRQAMREWPSGTRFLVCSDDVTEKVALAAEFKTVFSGLPMGRTRADLLLNDLAEMLLLSRCQHVIGSYGSSFSRFAAVYGGAPLQVIDVGA